ncbi:BRICHOS domain-containing protein 5 [Erpetoichthys calabaricus]|uniref:BRICHOS domain containing 5 n=1 Tax=Erpetoichthys calabaricus TaxID=27687 RepID=A0A8C4X9G6_ERPCA|nr:BRICHOS domain-containing protein 5 [Erpetoichthys calabaricus]
MERQGSCTKSCGMEKRPPSLSAHRTLWASLAVTLTVICIALAVLAALGIRSNIKHSPLQVVRITFQDQYGSGVNQSALLEKHGDLLTYHVTSHSNHTTAVLFDLHNKLLCYKPGHRETCFLRKIEAPDLESVQNILSPSQHKVDHFWLKINQTRYVTEFLGIQGKAHVDPLTLPKAFQTLCEHLPIFLARKMDGPGRQRLIYFCLDICFPSNICVSVCFYYLPE